MKSSQGLLKWGPLDLIRRNHGLEHATLNLLSEIHPQRAFAGHSDRNGFWIIGDVSTDILLETVQQALKRMKAGETSLAVHANCGTNYVTAGVIAGSVAWLGTLGNPKSFSRKLDRWPLLVLIVTGALIAAQPLGKKVQARITTSGNPGDLRVAQIIRYERQGPILHRVLTQDTPAPAVEPQES